MLSEPMELDVLEVTGVVLAVTPIVVWPATA